MTVSESLRRFRKQLNLSQTDVATTLGMPQQSYSRYESGKFAPRADDIIKLANVYKVSSDYLLGLSDTPQPTNFDEREVKEAFAIRDTWFQLQKFIPSVQGQATA